MVDVLTMKLQATLLAEADSNSELSEREGEQHVHDSDEEESGTDEGSDWSIFDYERGGEGETRAQRRCDGGFFALGSGITLEEEGAQTDEYHPSTSGHSEETTTDDGDSRGGNAHTGAVFDNRQQLDTAGDAGLRVGQRRYALSVYQETVQSLPPAFTTPHCPPVSNELVAQWFPQPCDCVSRHNRIVCCAKGGGARKGVCQDFLEETLAEAQRTCDDELRRSNSDMRLDSYKRCAYMLGYRTREPLPRCVLRAVRQAYPDADGIFMGYYAT